MTPPYGFDRTAKMIRSLAGSLGQVYVALWEAQLKEIRELPEPGQDTTPPEGIPYG